MRDEEDHGLPTGPGARPRLTGRTLRRWLPPLARRAPDLLTAYLLPGRLSPQLREARRVLRPGGTVRLLEHARARRSGGRGCA